MYGLTIKYKGPGCYRFIDTTDNTIYIGSAKKIHTRLNQHFSNKGSNVGKDAYSKTAKVEICKCDDYATALALEQYLINKYKPKYNKKDKDHNINSKAVINEEYYDKLENWQLYYELQKLDKETINLTNKQDRLVMAVTYAVFIIAILMFIF
ncbi:GIY-YIG nuclease family protein [Terrisporobacter petrolearius]|nr:GIY-YIG nuclease family protein [Terrisporobacter petrolearius]MCC3863378.1 GIY-YIG nuclease family protein [Terrisporobacter petrolearius]